MLRHPPVTAQISNLQRQRTLVARSRCQCHLQPRYPWGTFAMLHRDVDRHCCQIARIQVRQPCNTTTPSSCYSGSLRTPGRDHTFTTQHSLSIQLAAAYELGGCVGCENIAGLRRRSSLHLPRNLVKRHHQLLASQLLCNVRRGMCRWSSLGTSGVSWCWT